MNKNPQITFKINDIIELKLENEETVIYLNNQKFMLCKYLFFMDPQKNIAPEIDSIDDAAEYYGHQLGEFTPEELKEYFLEDYGITNEQVFWGHCSNLQAWVECHYDTRILHSNLAFPLLKKLAELGDSTARNVFTEEIVNRFLEGSPNTQMFLCMEGYLNLLREEELSYIISLKEARTLKRLERSTGNIFTPTVWSVSSNPNSYKIENGKVTKLKTINSLKEIPKEIKDLKNLTYIYCSVSVIETVPEWINELTKLTSLTLSQSGITHLPKLRLPNLIKFNAPFNNLEVADFTDWDVPNIKYIGLGDNNIKTIKGLSYIPNIEMLGLWRNNLKKLPKELLNLSNLALLEIKHGNMINLEKDEIVQKLKERGVIIG
ncbi:MAG: hypothetical protein GF311_02680 [Candidatus Lokiarchaeota archaeon]|nr:hypothetical protein [Candidatus Lokiarchaeota archaeon]